MAGAGAKEEKFYSGATQPERMVDSCLKDHLLFLLKSTVLLGVREGSAFFFFLPNNLTTCWHAQSYPFILLAFGTLGPAIACVLPVATQKSYKAICRWLLLVLGLEVPRQGQAVNQGQLMLVLGKVQLLLV